MINVDFRLNLGRILDSEAQSDDKDFDTPLPLDSLGEDGNAVFHLSAQQFSTHVAVLGPTGAGKSRLLWQMMREHRRQRQGFCVIDDGDLATDFLPIVPRRCFWKETTLCSRSSTGSS